MNIIFQVFFGFITGYLIASWIESFMHEYVSDALPRYVRVWKRFPRLCKYMINTYYSHHTIHHVKTYRQDHVTQFRSEEEKQRLIDELAARGPHGDIIIKSAFATRLAGIGALVFVSPLLVAMPILYVLFDWPGIVAGSLAMALPPFMSHFVHAYLHKPFAYGQEHAPAWLTFLLSTAYGRAVYRNHFMHHKYGGTSNFNLVLGADYLRNRERKVNQKDLNGMILAGMPLPSDMKTQNNP